eukprot:TRINITY_DN37931_c0_g1_i1.p1 TRINITY_DN37931_c0_g1~~TRINITY_DN37931_c0_g1_i1.p1  ORF type:complete len:104 (-),score=10.96 TRINITY_DN37931_c0_g1_i1:366-677(-)
MHINMDHFLEWSWKHENHLIYLFIGGKCLCKDCLDYERALPGWGGFIGFQTWMSARFASSYLRASNHGFVKFGRAITHGVLLSVGGWFDHLIWGGGPFHALEQ